MVQTPVRTLARSVMPIKGYLQLARRRKGRRLDGWRMAMCRLRGQYQRFLLLGGGRRLSHAVAHRYMSPAISAPSILSTGVRLPADTKRSGQSDGAQAARTHTKIDGGAPAMEKLQLSIPSLWADHHVLKVREVLRRTWTAWRACMPVRPGSRRWWCLTRPDGSRQPPSSRRWRRRVTLSRSGQNCR